MEIEILFEEDDFIVINKPAGILSQKASAQDIDISGILNQKLKKKFLAPVHRLDRNTTGAMILATSSSGARYLSEMIQKKELKKEYLFVCKGIVEPNGEINLPIKKLEHKNISQVNKDGAPATTIFTRLDTQSKISLVSAQIPTGRSHQIRIHFSHIGHPLLGDKKYGKKPWSEAFSRQALHAHKISFVHPIKKTFLEIQATLPEDLKELISRYQLNF